ncbi:recombination regulator RecX [Caballeronia pedi]|uniref:Regulatory protein RecX n=1 Tax=Caballeronia pedi TaxID=1777141 RepID=A0A157Z6C3_9BURK|nr:recombination regulator RecX [Caballeronia pedi]SAK41098.1 recombination regulator RecX [Caballeronia pedi]
MRKRRFGSKTDTADEATGDGSESADRYERSSERRPASTKSSGFTHKTRERADAKSFASARRVFEPAKDDESSVDASDRATRLEQARALLKQAAEQPKARPADRAPHAEPARNPAEPDSTPFTDPFEDADPFEPFEQCAPAEPVRAESGESVYSRSSQRVRKTSASELNDPKRPQRSLKARALGFLSRREYSRAELSRKLRPYAEEANPLETLLDSLERDGWLSNERFVESVVHRRASRMGGSRIISELKRHAVGDTLISETADKLAQSETARAQAVWEKKYGVLPETPAERSRQARFLAARGFSGGTIGKILKGGDEDWTDEPVDD